MPTYKGIVVQEVEHGPKVVLLSAPALDIAAWSGIPQRRRLATGEGGDVQTAGFQREEAASRVAAIAEFMRDDRNVIQNPLLAAVQDSAAVNVIESPDGSCTVEIANPNLGALALLDLIEKVCANLVGRLPELANREANPAVKTELRRLLSAQSSEIEEHLAQDHSSDSTYSEYVGGEPDLDDEEWVDRDERPDSGDEAEDTSDELSAGLFLEETQVIDFYDELLARADILTELDTLGGGLDSIGGFDREFLESLLRPVVLVDGQHRLRGTLEAVKNYLESDAGCDEIANAIDDGLEPQEATEAVAAAHSRVLPVSLLLNDSPAEHVFQFVVVNQKATPMSSALLGTIVSTSLTRAEMAPIEERLTKADIQLEASRSAAYLTNHPDSPFFGLVSTGIAGDKKRVLAYSALLKLVAIVRDLKGPKADDVDWLKLWRNDYFPACGLIQDGVPEGERLAAWRDDAGPWRELFIRLHTKIRDKFGDTGDMKAFNAWGDVVQSNLFNMEMLTILTTDFFRFLTESKLALDDWDAVDNALEDWVGPLNASYFNRDWRMQGAKRGQTMVRDAWASNWYKFRMTKSLPPVTSYNPGSKKR